MLAHKCQFLGSLILKCHRILSGASEKEHMHGKLTHTYENIHKYLSVSSPCLNGEFIGSDLDHSKILPRESVLP